jgi:hypothetical protein
MSHNISLPSSPISDLSSNIKSKTSKRTRPVVKSMITDDKKDGSENVIDDKKVESSPQNGTLQSLPKIKCSICKKEGHNKRSCNIINTNISISDNEIKLDVKDETKSTTDDILSVNYWKDTKTFKSIKDKETQIKYYKRMNSCEEVLQLVELESKPFGSAAEKIIQEIFKLDPRTSTQNDGTKNGKKIEIKSARYWAGKDDCIWQHLEPDHDYEFALFTLLDFDGWKVWGIKKSLLMGELRDKKIVTFQGKQGYWVRKSAILSYLIPIHNISELDIFIQS